MLKNIFLSLKFSFYYFGCSLIFYTIVKFSWIYNAESRLLSFLAILSISLFCFYQGIKYTIIKPALEKKRIKPLLVISLLEIAVITYTILLINMVDNIQVMFSMIIIILEFSSTYIHLSKKWEL